MITEVNGMSVAFQSCIKQPRAFKAKVHEKWSLGADGMRRHEIPKGYFEARRHPEAPLIWAAMLREFNSHMDCGTWEYRPESECYADGREPIDCMWVYDCKVDQTSREFLLWKARLVGRGDQMVYLRDFFQTYSGVVRLSTFRIFLAVCALYGLQLTGADVSTAYLHAPLRNCTVWMRQPRGFGGVTVNGEPALCLLKMALYGLRQSAREWALTLCTWLLAPAQAFRRCISDRYLFVKRVGDSVMYLLLWVDDIFIGCNDVAMRGTFMKSFMAEFRVKDLGALRQGLGASIMQDLEAGTVTLSLATYIGDVARKFDLSEDVSWADIPVPVALYKECVAAVVTEAESADYIEAYRTIVGCVVFIATFVRPDVAFAAHALSTFNSKPGAVHMRLARRVMGYLSLTRDLCLTYRRGDGASISSSFKPQPSTEPLTPDRTGLPHQPVDSDHAIVRSTTGWLTMMAGAAVMWAVRSQLNPSLSSSEAELYGLSTSVCDLLAFLNVLEEMEVGFKEAVPILVDSRAARLIAEDCASSARTRHIHRRWFFVQFFITDGMVRIVEVRGTHNPANFMTKAVGGASFRQDRCYALGIRETRAT